jgi:hypothetical protein
MENVKPTTDNRSIPDTKADGPPGGLSVVRFQLALFPREFHLDETGRATAPEAELLRDPMPDHPRDSIAREQQGNPPPLLAGDLGVHEEVLEFLFA